MFCVWAACLLYCATCLYGWIAHFVSDSHICLHKYKHIITAHRCPGFGLTLVSESTGGITHASENSSVLKRTCAIEGHQPASGQGVSPHPVLPEDIGKQAALMLVEEIVKV